MGEVLVFQHDPFEDLGFFAEVLKKQGPQYRVVRLFHGEMPTEEWPEVAALIVLGGPMGIDEEESFPFLRWEKRIIRAAIDEALDGLSPREAQVLRMRFGLDTTSDRTLEEVGKQFDVTRERIRQIEIKAMRKLMHPSRADKLRPFLER